MCYDYQHAIGDWVPRFFCSADSDLLDPFGLRRDRGTNQNQSYRPRTARSKAGTGKRRRLDPGLATTGELSDSKVAEPVRHSAPRAYRRHLAASQPTAVIPTLRSLVSLGGKLTKTGERRHSSLNNSRTGHRLIPGPYQNRDSPAVAHTCTSSAEGDVTHVGYGGRLPTSEHWTPGGGRMVIHIATCPSWVLHFSHKAVFLYLEI